MTVDWATAMCNARRSQPSGLWPRHPYHRQIKAIIFCHLRCFPRFGDFSTLDTQMGSRPGHNKGVTIDQAIAICRARRPRPHGPQPQHPCHRQIKAIISRHHRCFPCFRDLSILDRPMLEIFRKKKL